MFPRDGSLLIPFARTCLKSCGLLASCYSFPLLRRCKSKSERLPKRRKSKSEKLPRRRDDGGGHQALASAALGVDSHTSGIAPNGSASTVDTNVAERACSLFPPIVARVGGRVPKALTVAQGAHFLTREHLGWIPVDFRLFLPKMLTWRGVSIFGD